MKLATLDKTRRKQPTDEHKSEFSVKAFYDNKTKLAIASTAVLDRQDEIIDQKGWVLDNFKNNNPLLWSHNSYEPLIGNCKNARVEKVNGKYALVFEPDFHEETELARAVKALYEQGRLKTFSVGFKPLDMDGNIYTKQELLEISAVNVPANPEAQMLAYRSLSQKGFDRNTINEVLGKGIVEDVANQDELWYDKYVRINDCFAIFDAFCEIYFAPQSAVEDFSGLLNEVIELFTQIADGTYNEEEAAKSGSAILKQVIDNKSNPRKNVPRQAKAAAAAPKSNKYHEERISMLKVIARATEILTKGEDKLPKADKSNLTKVIKRATEITISQHKGEMNDHG